MYKIAICDDDKNCADSFSVLLKHSFCKQNFPVEITHVTDSQDIIYYAIKKKQLDILFLDIDFKNSNKNGIEFAKELRKVNKNFYLIFVTAHSRYMPLSFLSKTFDFLIKPVNEEIINDLVSRMIEEFHSNHEEMIAITKKIYLKPSVIGYIEKFDNRCEIYTSGETISCVSTLDKLLSMLPSNFIRIHRSYIVNRDQVDFIDQKDKKIILCGGKILPIGSQFFMEE